MELKGKKIVALGQREGVPGGAIEACARSAGGELLFAQTECFV
jgi:glycine/sarcosine/betaine reductase complex component A